MVTERADVRSWRTVADEICLAAPALPADQHELAIRFLDDRDGLATQRTIPGVQVSSGQRTFAMVRTVQ